MSDGPILNVALQVPPEAGMVSVVRRFFEQSVAHLTSESEALHRLSLAVHELLENAAKYSVGESATLTVHFDPRVARTRICLTHHTTSEHVERLRSCIGEIDAATDPFAHYHRLMHATAELAQESGLGLARIRAESDLALSLQVDGTKVTIVATSQ